MLSGLYNLRDAQDNPVLSEPQQDAIVGLLGNTDAGPAPATPAPTQGIVGLPPAEEAALPPDLSANPVYDPSYTNIARDPLAHINLHNDQFGTNLLLHPHPDMAASGIAINADGIPVHPAEAAHILQSGADPKTLSDAALANVAFATSHDPKALVGENYNHADPYWQQKLALAQQIAGHQQGYQSAQDQVNKLTDLSAAHQVRATSLPVGMRANSPEAKTYLDGQVALANEQAIRGIKAPAVAPVMGADGQIDAAATTQAQTQADMQARQQYAADHYGITDPTILSHFGDADWRDTKSLKDMASDGDGNAKILAANWKTLDKIDTDAGKIAWMKANGVDTTSEAARRALTADSVNDSGTALSDENQDWNDPTDNRHDLTTGDAVRMGLLAILSAKAPPGAIGQELQGYLGAKEADASAGDKSDQDLWNQDRQMFGAQSQAVAQQAQQQALAAQEHQAQVAQLGNQLIQGYTQQTNNDYRNADLGNKTRLTDAQVKKMKVDGDNAAKKIQAEYIANLTKMHAATDAADLKHRQEVDNAFKILNTMPPDPPGGLGPKRRFMKTIMPNLTSGEYDAAARSTPGAYIRDVAAAGANDARARSIPILATVAQDRALAYGTNIQSMIKHRAAIEKGIDSQIVLRTSVVGKNNAASDPSVRALSALKVSVAADQKHLTDIELAHQDPTTKQFDFKTLPPGFKEDYQATANRLNGNLSKASNIASGTVGTISRVKGSPPPPKGSKPVEIGKGVWLGG